MLGENDGVPGITPNDIIISPATITPATPQVTVDFLIQTTNANPLVAAFIPPQIMLPPPYLVWPWLMF